MISAEEKELEIILARIQSKEAEGFRIHNQIVILQQNYQQVINQLNQLTPKRDELIRQGVMARAKANAVKEEKVEVDPPVKIGAAKIISKPQRDSLEKD